MDVYVQIDNNYVVFLYTDVRVTERLIIFSMRLNSS